MQSQFEAMMADLIAAGQAPTEAQAAEHIKSASESMPQMPAAAKEAVAGGKKEETFQDTIKRTMDRMQESDSTAKTASSTSAAGEGGEEQMLMDLMKSLNAGGDGGGEGGEEDFNAMLMSMMTQLTNKEILYEPMKELHEKYPGWMETHAATEAKEDMVRYVEQQQLVGEIVGRFERRGYSDENEEDREYIVERMQKVSLRGDLRLSFGLADDGCRCKQLVRRLRISWAIRLPRNRRWETWMQDVQRNNTCIGRDSCHRINWSSHH